MLTRSATTSGFTPPKIPERISAACVFRRKPRVGGVDDDNASIVLDRRTSGLGPRCSDGTQVRLTTAHHEDVAAMHATYARAPVVGPIMVPTLRTTADVE